MRLLLTTLLTALFFIAKAQTYAPNLDFETGTTDNWTFYRGHIQEHGIWTLSTCLPAPTLHVITNAGDTDFYCGIRTVGAGQHSLRIGKDSFQHNADGASYNIHVPDMGQYMVHYYYAVVRNIYKEDSEYDDPRFEVSVIDSATGGILFCTPLIVTRPTAAFLSVGLPLIYYADWRPGNIDLHGMNGMTVTVMFKVAGCSRDAGGHWSYAYIDMGYGPYAKINLECGNHTMTLTSPTGYGTYLWTDSLTFTPHYGTDPSIVIPIPTDTTTYALIATPYLGFGCPDTLYTRLLPTSLSIDKSHDTTICLGSSVKIWGGGKDLFPMHYLWTPATGLGCTTCDTTFAKPPAGLTSYRITTSDTVQCSRTDTVNVRVYAHPVITATVADLKCFGDHDGYVATHVSGGSGQYQYLWQQGVVLDSLPHLTAGIYTLYLRDGVSQCSDTVSFTVKQSDSMQVKAIVTDDKCRTGVGHIDLEVSGGTAPYSYLLSGKAAVNPVTKLKPGKYEVRVTDAKSCTDSIAVVVADTCIEVIIPDVITPNGDGINDVWVINGLQNYPANTVQLFDKWGTMVYEKNNYGNDWAGSGTKGVLPDGTYFYLVKLNGPTGDGKNVFTGTVLIKR